MSLKHTIIRTGAAVLYSFAALSAAPKNVTPADWAGIRSAYERHKQAVYAEGEGFQARNLGQRWVTRFDGRGFEVTPDSAAWRWGLALVSFGFAGAEKRVVQAQPKAAGGRFTYQWDANLTEWFINDRRGLEHGFTLVRRPKGDSGPLLFRLSVRGTLLSRVRDEGRTVAFTDGGGVTLLNYAGLKVTDAQGRELPARFMQDGDGLRLEVTETEAQYPLTVDPVAQQAYLKPAAVGLTHVADSFGWSVAISGDTVVVGAPFEDSSTTGVNSTPDELASNAGAAYVFTRSGGVWSQQAYLKPSGVGTTQVEDWFGASVAISGDTIVIGAPNEDSSATGVNNTPNELASGAGAAYVFTRSGGVWTQQAYLKPAAVGATQAADNFGSSVAISGDTIVVGAFFEDSSTTGVNSTPNESAPVSGAAYVFARSGGVWSQQAYLKPAAVGVDQSGDGFGYSVAISGDTLVVGAWREKSSTTGVNSTPDESSIGAGAAYVFMRTSDVWSQQAFLKPAAVGSSQSADNFGFSVAISADTIVVGAPYEDSSTTGVNDTPNESATDAGAAYVFTRSGGIWRQQAFLKPAAVGATQSLDFFGASVAISGDTIVVGAWGEDSSTTGVNSTPNESATEAGAAYVFTRTFGAWIQQDYFKPAAVGTLQAFDNFGRSVAISGDTIVVGAWYEDSFSTGVNSTPNESGPNAGAAYVFVVEPCSFTVVSTEPALALPAAGGSVPVTFTATPAGCAWTAGVSPAAAAAGLSVSQSSGTGSATVNVTAALNTTGYVRASSVSIAGNNIPTLQPSVLPGSCTATLASSSLAAPQTGVKSSVNLTTGDACAWLAASDQPWAQVFPISWTGSRPVEYTVLPNFTTRSRTALLSIAGQPFTVTQPGSTEFEMRRFVRQMYFNFFGRLPSEAEVEFNVNAISAGIVTRTSLVLNFFNSAEFNLAGRFIAGLYVGILNRNAEYGGWLFNRNALTSGAVQYTSLVNNFLDSAEFKLNNPSLTNRQFAALMYRQILLREGASAELDFMEAALAGGLSRVQFATNFLQSLEFRLGTGPRLTTFVLQACLLLRDATPTEFANAVMRLSPPSNTPVSTLFSEMLASVEFADLLK